MKIRVLTATSKGKLKAIAEELATRAANGIYKADIIPPAYSCDQERLIIILVTPGSIPKKPDFERFIDGLTRERSRNVAFIVDGTEAEIAPYVEKVRANNVEVVEPVLYMDGGLPSVLSMFSRMSETEKQTAFDWYDGVLTRLK